jgi:chaperonin GroES
MKFKPLKDRLLVKYSDRRKVQEALHPGQRKEKPQKGEVIAAGPGRITDDGKLQK